MYVLAWPGDNPNYWISMTASAEVLRTTRKVKRLIEEANKEIKKQKKVGTCQPVCLQPCPFLFLGHSVHAPSGSAVELW
jgi:hypothetical protein